MTDCVLTRPSLFQTKVLRGDTEAVELLVGFPVPDGDEEGQGMPVRGLGLGQGLALANYWVSGVGWVFFLARTLSRWPTSRLPGRRV